MKLSKAEDKMHPKQIYSPLTTDVDDTINN